MKELCPKAACASEKFYTKICIAVIGSFLCIQCLQAQVPDTTAAIITNEITPLKITSFSGRLIDDNEAALNWHTSGGISETRFEIAWSSDNRHWQTVGTVAISNKDSISNYSFKYSQTSLTNFYRIKIINIDGQFTYSAVIRINGSNQAVAIYPNPARNNVIISSFNDKPATVFFINSSGKTLLRKTINEPVSSFNISSFAPGNYIIRIIRDSKATVYQLVKQ